ncbi:lycopene cyclase family protein [Winogradskyella tangerina]|uniref:lycopene cyclase family protein n=1 Tax=Winogradskyella tangerina TaxID=2023240 RepID=UPI000DBE1364|nr:lycopene cyclase family protein [Winogradskyella tangerina]
MTKYDYIILGAGASGLMLAYRMAQDSFFDDKSILIIDRVRDKGNDRTWCYWENGEGEWDHILTKTWPKIFFGSEKYSDTIEIAPYSYKMISSENFYDALWKVISKKSNITFIESAVKSFNEHKDSVEVITDKEHLTCGKLFNSIAKPDLYIKQKKYPVLQQHFLGWFVKTKEEVFDDSIATFMDFTIAQKGNTRFMYVLPMDKKTALFEYTLFSQDLLERSEYEDAIKQYLSERNISDYEIIEKEMGSIPMTSFKFFKLDSKHILNIGTAGGWTKASTGYTFRNTTKKTEKLLSFLKQEQDLSKFNRMTKFWYYDLLFLDVLYKYNKEGANLFASMFRKGNTNTIFKFLDEESSVIEDLKIITSVPSKRFIQSLLKRVF